MRRLYLFPVFLLCLGLVVLVILFGQLGFLSFFQDSIQSVFFPVSSVLKSHSNPEVAQLQKENETLQQQVSAMASLEADNKALRDQFQTANPSSKDLLPAVVVGMPGAIPNISFPEVIILDKGTRDNIVIGMAVIEQDFLIGIVTNVSNNFSEATLITSKKSSLSVKDEQTGASGVAKGEGSGTILLDNVLLSDRLKNNDSIVSLGSQSITGKGIMPGLILGKILSIDKNPSSLFQTARVTPLIPFDRLTTVFIVTK